MLTHWPFVPTWVRVLKQLKYLTHTHHTHTHTQSMLGNCSFLWNKLGVGRTLQWGWGCLLSSGLPRDECTPVSEGTENRCQHFLF